MSDLKAQPTTAVSSPVRWPRIAVTAVFVVHGLLFASWTAHIPDVKAHLGLTDGTLGFALLGAPVGSVTAMIASSWLLPRVGSRRIVQVALVGYCSAGPLVGLTGSLPALFAALFAWGAFQGTLVYPMLDDRNTTPGTIPAGVLTWTYDNNYTGWHALLGDDIGGDRVSPVAAPGRLADFTRLAPAYIEVGDLDIFRDEGIAYAAGLANAGVPVELHVHPGAPHGFKRFAPDAGVARRAMADRARAVAAI